MSPASSPRTSSHRSTTDTWAVDILARLLREGEDDGLPDRPESELPRDHHDVVSDYNMVVQTERARLLRAYLHDLAGVAVD